MRKIYDLRPELINWEGLTPQQQGFAPENRAFYVIPERKVAFTKIRGCASIYLVNEIIKTFFLKDSELKIEEIESKKVDFTFLEGKLLSRNVPQGYDLYTIVRDPFDRFLEAYDASIRGDEEFLKFDLPRSVNDFIIWSHYQNPIQAPDHIKPQWVGVFPSSKIVPLSKEGFEIINKKLGTNLDFSPSVGSLFLSDAQKEFLSRMYHVDVKMFELAKSLKKA